MKKENLKLWRRWKKGDRDARNLLIEKNEKLIFLFLKQTQPSISYFYYCGIPEEDIIAELKLALIKAVEYWNPKKGSLSTYAFRVFRTAISKLFNKARLVHFDWEPENLFWELQKILERRKVLSLEDVAQEMGVTPQQVQKLLKMRKPVESLDRKISDDGDGLYYLDNIPSDGIPLEEKVVAQLELEEEKKLIKEALSHLSPRERFVVEAYYGLGDGKRRTLKEIGKLLGKIENRGPLSKERVRQIKIDALKRMRRVICKKNRKTPCL